MGEKITSFLDMSNRELFCVLTGDRGIMAQAALQGIVREYMRRHPDSEESLSAMVKAMAEEE